MKWAIVPRDEQETIISVNYFERTLTVYTSRRPTANRLIKKIGDPTLIHYSDGLVTGITYEKNLFDKDISKFFSKGLIIGAFREQNAEDDESVRE